MLFSSREAALLEGKKKNGFIAKLTLRCEKEFDDSVCNVRKTLHNTFSTVLYC